jgi:hypothetical protein
LLDLGGLVTPGAPGMKVARCQILESYPQEM